MTRRRLPSVDTIAKALLSDLTRKGGNHGCLFKVKPKHPESVLIDGHVDLESLAEAVLALLAKDGR